MKVGEKLRILRKLKGFTQEEIAEKLNISRRAYSFLENDTTKIDVPRMNQIAKIYGIELEELLNFNEGQAFTNCFNNNINGFFSAEKVYAHTSKEEREFFVGQIQQLIKNQNEERKHFIEILSSLKQIVDKSK